MTWSDSDHDRLAIGRVGSVDGSAGRGRAGRGRVLIYWRVGDGGSGTGIDILIDKRVFCRHLDTHATESQN